MRRAAIAGLAVALIAGLAVAGVRAGDAQRRDAFSIGVYPATQLAPLTAGQQICQTPVVVPEPFDRVEVVFNPAPDGPIRVTVHQALSSGDAGPMVARGRLPAGTPAGPAVAVLDRRVRAGTTVGVCVERGGRRPAQIWGDTDPARTPAASQAVLDGRPTSGDLYLAFPQREPRSLLASLPAAFRHAVPFKLGGIGAWTFWLLAALVVVGGPLLLGRALVRAVADEEPEGRAG